MPENTSLFAHERIAFEKIKKEVKSRSLGQVITNLHVHDKESNQYLETDLILISANKIFIVELKHWSGEIEIAEHSWLQNRSFSKKDPHKSNNFKAKVLRGLVERQFPQYHLVFFESVVVLTNPHVIAYGAHTPSTQQHNPTFQGIDDFIKYVINQNSSSEKLNKSQRKSIKDFLKSMQTISPPKDFIFPDYEIVERLYQSQERAVLIARRTDIRYSILCRLRIFFPPNDSSEQNKTLFRQKATSTLETVARINQHPNILKVWSIPNENQYIVEGSDWSEQGTLYDIIKNEGPLETKRAIRIINGILEGLKAIHEKYIIHRRLTTKNILMVNDIPKLMNFDLSYRLEDDRATVVPDSSKLRRNPYIAPEIYEGKNPPEASADLFSAGVILYEMLTKERPFSSSEDLINSNRNGTLTNAQLINLDSKKVMPAVKELIVNLIQLDPERRPINANKVIETLKKIQGPEEKIHVGNKKLEPKTTFDKYEITQFYTKGVDAQIYKGVGVNGKPVSIKLFNRDIPLNRIINEQNLANTIHHPSIVKVDSYGTCGKDKRWFIAFDWIEGTSLHKEIENASIPDENQFRNTVLLLLDAISKLHNHKENDVLTPILHNDIKPENILLDKNKRPVLIDFGTSSHPKIALYEGTRGYVAPDLQQGQDRNFCIDGDLYSLGITLYEWLSCSFYTTGNDLDLSQIPQNLHAWFKRATAKESTDRFSSASEMAEEFEKAYQSHEEIEKEVINDSETETLLIKTEEVNKIEHRNKIEPNNDNSQNETLKAKIDEATEIESKSDIELNEDEDNDEAEPPELSQHGIGPTNTHNDSFLAYLNSLHCTSLASENALAESQATNDFFRTIHVEHPVTDIIFDILSGKDKRHVVLTGHAGDGKSTIALDIYKRLKSIDFDKSISMNWNRREDIELDGLSITIIKDLSECSDIAMDIVDEMLSGNRRFLLVSNTGTLLSTLKKAEKRQVNGDVISVESKLLDAMTHSEPTSWKYSETDFEIINLSRIDNLSICEQIFRKMVAKENWRYCETNKCNGYCPVLRNISLIQDNLETVVSRILLAYRRMYEYGIRLTLRQICAHLAYMITSGLNSDDINNLSKTAAKPLVSDYMFFNRFFGDNGRCLDQSSLQLRAIREVRLQNFGIKPAPVWERKLWINSVVPFQLKAKKCENEFSLLRKYGIQECVSEDITDEQARNQVRRMIYFLHDLKTKDDKVFLKSFLNSPMIVDFEKWHKENSQLQLTEEKKLWHQVLHVLQEHFTGVKLPEGTKKDSHIYITLSRQSQNIRQSAQAILAKIPIHDFKIELQKTKNKITNYNYKLALKNTNTNKKAKLTLGLPFLDYVFMRNQGDIGRSLQASYVDRLEKFKGQLLLDYENGKENNITLIRLNTNYTFDRKVFKLSEGYLEVINDS